jgi:hypothetical protein
MYTIFAKTRKTKTQSLNVIHEIKTENNTIVKSASDILSNLCTYYETLYTSSNVSDNFIDSYWNETKCITLSNKERLLCDEFPTVNECENALNRSRPLPFMDSII